MPLSSQLQQHWQTVCERLPESLPASSLSEQAKSVLTFSDFVQESVSANPDWLAELRAHRRRRRVAAVCQLAANRAGRCG
jgi:glutamate-ammonia-ligase adenylyltransferase